MERPRRVNDNEQDCHPSYLTRLDAIGLVIKGQLIITRYEVKIN